MSGQAAMAAEPQGPGAGAQGAATFTSFARSCTLHGLGRIFVPGAPAPRRLLWAGAFLASLGTFLLQAGQRVRHYAAYPRVTALDEAQSRVLIFPAITLCNYNRIRRSQLTLNDLFWLGGDLLAVGTEDFPHYLHALGRTPNLDGFFPSKSYDLGAFYQRAGHPIDEMLLRCRFRGRDCGPENFTTVSAAAMAMATTTAGSALGRAWAGPQSRAGFGAVGCADCSGVGCGVAQAVGQWVVQAVACLAVGQWGEGGTVPAHPTVPYTQGLGEAAPVQLLLPTVHQQGCGEMWCHGGDVGSLGMWG